MSTCRQINAANVKLAIMRTAIEISKSTAGSATVEFRNALMCRAIFFSFADLRHLTVHENEKLLLFNQMGDKRRWQLTIFFSGELYMLRH